MTRLAAFLYVLLLLPPPLAAQEEKASFTLFGSFLTPLGKYGSKIGDNAAITRRFGFDIGEEAGLSSPGFGIGIEFRTPVIAEGLEWIVSLQGLTNGANPSEVTDFFNDELHDSVRVDITTGSWYHIPLFTGLMYSFDLMEGVGFSVNLQGGVNITQQASRTVKVDNVQVERTTFRFMPDFGYEAGIGLTFFGGYQLLVRYIDLATPRYEGTRILNEVFFTTIPRRENAIAGDSRPVKMLVVSLGYTL